MLRPPTVKKKQIIHTKEEFLDFVNENIGKTNIFVNLYHFSKSSCCNSFYYFDKKTNKFTCNKCKNVIQFFNLNSFTINCVVFDIDPKPNNKRTQFRCFLKVKRMNRYFKDYRRYIVKSGKGFHFYIETNPQKESDFKHGARNALRAFQISTEKMFGKTDPITHGDTSQMIRVPGTWNINSRCFCFSLEEKHLKMTYKNLIEISKESQNSITINLIDPKATKRINLLNYDNKIESTEFVHEGELTVNFKKSGNKEKNLTELFKPYNVNYEKLSSCVKILLNNEFLDYNQRFLLINIIKNFGISIQDCEKIIENVLFTDSDSNDPDEKKRYNWAKHCINEERQVFYVYHKSYGIPSCKSGETLGFKSLKICDNCKTKNIMCFR